MSKVLVVSEFQRGYFAQSSTPRDVHGKLPRMSLAQVSIQPRFCGPSTSGNGGYTSGLLAGFLSGSAEVTLRAPPPVNVPLQVERAEDERILLMDGATVVAEARAVELAPMELPEAVSWEGAQAASRVYPGFHHHQYPSCFVCGPARPFEDGLALFPGAVADRKVVAAPWQPATDLGDAEGRVLPVFMWAALDCPSWFGYAAFNEPLPPILLGRLSAQIAARPLTGDRCVVMGWSLGREGRKIRCASAVFSEDGKALAWAQAIWVALKE